MKNKGYFIITDELLKSEWESFCVIFNHFRPTRIEFRHWENNVWYYYGVSSLFDEIIEGQSIPQYDIVFARYDEGLRYKFKRV